MTVPVLIEQTGGQFEAKLVGDATMSATAPTREGAVSALKSKLNSKQSRGELLWVTLNPTPAHILLVRGRITKTSMK